MTTETAILGLVISAFALFGGVLAWASWEESRATRQKQKNAKTESANR